MNYIICEDNKFGFYCWNKIAKLLWSSRVFDLKTKNLQATLKKLVNIQIPFENDILLVSSFGVDNIKKIIEMLLPPLGSKVLLMMDRITSVSKNNLVYGPSAR